MARADLVDMALTQVSHLDLQRLCRAATEREPGQSCLALDFYNHRDLSGRLDQQRYCVARFTWGDGRWHRIRRLTGSRRYEEAQADLEFQSKRLGIPLMRHT